MKSTALSRGTASVLVFLCIMAPAGLLATGFVGGSGPAGGPLTSGRIHLVPAPVSLREDPGEFKIEPGVTIEVVAKDTQVFSTAAWWAARLSASAGFQLRVEDGASRKRKVIRLQINAQADTSLGFEGYSLSVTPAEIILTANAPAGIFYGLQSLWQILPPDVERAGAGFSALPVPCCQIKDYPRFGWRGLMLDVSRHFFTKSEVEQYIDQMARYKFNVFHMHLSDDNGWRIEIKSLPQLTSEGAWRVPRTGRWGAFLPPLADEPATAGGFYTQEDMKEIIAYARQRFITILPEIDVPAHSLALISAFPNLSCTQLPYPVNPGSKTPERQDNVLCVGNDSVYLILDKIFTEIAALFPCPYIHIGGDEAYKGFWDNCPKCRRLMETEHLSNVDELQSYFVKRMEKMLEAKGKRLIGWDEILEGGLAPSATVMSWRGMQGGVTAAKLGHPVVMTPWDFTYLDLYQGDPNVEPPTYGMCRLSDCYHYDPVPDSVDPSLILGGQGNLWTESVPNFRHAEYMTWPRALALSEVYWSPKALRNWPDFVERMEAQFPRLDAAGINYARSAFQVIAEASHDKNGDLLVHLATEVPGLDIYYTFDDTRPDAWSPKYSGQVLTFPVGADILTMVSYRDGRPIGERVAVTKEDLEKRANEGHHVY